MMKNDKKPDIKDDGAKMTTNKKKTKTPPKGGDTHSMKSTPTRAKEK